MQLKIFLVEDSEVIRRNLTESLEELSDARVVGFAATQSDAMAWLLDERHAWDLAVVDLFLTEGNGLSVLQASRGMGASQKMVVLSNYATPQMRLRCMAEGADRVFDKSTELDQFLSYVLASGRPGDGQPVAAVV